jgi:hypothetical protein
MPKKWVKIKQQKNKLVNNLKKEGNISEELKKYYCKYKKVYNKVIGKAKKLHNNVGIKASRNKSRAMWDLIKGELSKQKNVMTNTEISVNAAKIQDSETIDKVFNEYYAGTVQNILCGSPLPNSNEGNSVK